LGSSVGCDWFLLGKEQISLAYPMRSIAIVRYAQYHLHLTNFWPKKIVIKPIWFVCTWIFLLQVYLHILLNKSIGFIMFLEFFHCFLFDFNYNRIKWRRVWRDDGKMMKIMHLMKSWWQKQFMLVDSFFNAILVGIESVTPQMWYQRFRDHHYKSREDGKSQRHKLWFYSEHM